MFVQYNINPSNAARLVYRMIHGTSKRTKSKYSCSSTDWYSPKNSSLLVLFDLLALDDVGLERLAKYANCFWRVSRVFFVVFGSGYERGDNQLRYGELNGGYTYLGDKAGIARRKTVSENTFNEEVKDF